MNRFALLASFVLAGVMLGGCPETARCPEGQERVNRACVPSDGIDGGVDDAGVVDGGPDGGPCGECPATAQYCVVDRDGGPACSECDPGIGNESCSAFTDRPICDRDTARCVACTSNDHCTDPEASRCVDNECVPCSESSDCDHVMDEVTALPICAGTGDDARCVQCTEATEAIDCGSFACDGLTGRCTLDQRLQTNCGACDEDTDCQLPLRCVPMNYMGTPRAGGYCLRPRAAAPECEIAYTTILEDRVSLSGRPADDNCGINEANTTCEAVRAYGQNCGAGGDPAPCNGFGASRCGSLSMGALVNRCTYACSFPFQCVGEAPCVSGQCQ